METGYDQILRSVAQVKIADQIGDYGDGDGVKVSCFTEVFDDVTLQFQIIRLTKQVPAINLAWFFLFLILKTSIFIGTKLVLIKLQIYVWVGCNSAKFGNLYAAASTRPVSSAKKLDPKSSNFMGIRVSSV